MSNMLALLLVLALSLISENKAASNGYDLKLLQPQFIK